MSSPFGYDFRIVLKKLQDPTVEQLANEWDNLMVGVRSARSMLERQDLEPIWDSIQQQLDAELAEAEKVAARIRRLGHEPETAPRRKRRYG